MHFLYFKFLLTWIGSRLSRGQVYRLEALVSYLRLGKWLAEHGYNFSHPLRDRWAVFDSVASRVQDKKVLYLEFGVYKGDATRYWSRKLRHPETKLHGFDSFEGLPKDWGPHRKGTFNLCGIVPKIDDPRVTFYKGWFEDVLPTYSVPEHDVLVIICDADLYSATICALRHLRPYIKSGTYIYFDEMNHVDHEPRAFEDFIRESSLQFRPISADRSLCYQAYECYES